MFDVFCVPIGEYKHEAHPQLPADDEARLLTEVLHDIGGEPDVWVLPPDRRDRSNVDERLVAWSAVGPRSSVMFWAGHGESDGHDAFLATYDTGDPISHTGVSPADVARHIRAEWGSRRAEDGAWTIVVIEACGAKRFVQQLVGELMGRPNVPERLALIGAGSEGTSHLGDLRAAVAQALASYTDNDEQIRLDDLVGRIRGRLREKWVQDLAMDEASPFPRRRLLPGAVTAPLDIYAELREFLRGLTPDERGHFIPKAQGAEQGELAWYFAGRAEERGQIASWLRTSTAGMLIVTGRAGSGKSALLGNVLVHTNPALSELLTKAGQLESIPDNERPPGHVFAVVMHLTGMTTAEVVQRLAAVVDAPDPNIEAVLETIGDNSFCLLVDALDEAQEPASVAATVLRRVAALPAGRVVAGTRKSTKEGPDQPDTPDEDLLDALGRASDTVVVEVDRDPEAIATYVRRRLTAASMPPAAVDRIVGLIGAQPCQFLFARLAVHEILAHPSLVDDADALASLLSKDHRALFSVAVERLTAASPVNYPSLEALALAQGRGLPQADGVWTTVATALASGGMEVTDTDIDALLEAAAPYVMLDAEAGQSVYRLAHQTFREHFLARYEN